MFFLHFLQTSIDLSMGFLTMHVDPIEKQNTFETCLQKTHGFFAFFADFDQFVHGVFD